jgi:hypothetical protein
VNTLTCDQVVFMGKAEPFYKIGKKIRVNLFVKYKSYGLAFFLFFNPFSIFWIREVETSLSIIDLCISRYFDGCVRKIHRNQKMKKYSGDKT